MSTRFPLRFLASLLLVAPFLGHAGELAPLAKAVGVFGAEAIQFKSKIIQKESFELKVLLPRSYSQNSDTRYPVIYVTDGDINFDFVSGSLRYMELGAALGAPIQDHIVVAIGYGTNDPMVIVKKRARDLTPTAVNPPQFPLETEHGNAEAFMQVLKQEVFPRVEKKYRALPTQRVLFGHSYGGLFGAYALFKHTDAFATYALSSPSLWWDSGVLLSMEQEFAQSHPVLEKTVVLTVGALEDPAFMLAPIRAMGTALGKYQGIHVKSVELTDYDHLSVPSAAFALAFRVWTSIAR